MYCGVCGEGQPPKGMAGATLRVPRPYNQTVRHRAAMIISPSLPSRAPAETLGASGSPSCSHLLLPAWTTTHMPGSRGLWNRKPGLSPENNAARRAGQDHASSVLSPVFRGRADGACGWGSWLLRGSCSQPIGGAAGSRGCSCFTESP